MQVMMPSGRAADNGVAVAHSRYAEARSTVLMNNCASAGRDFYIRASASRTLECFLHNYPLSSQMGNEI